ncbi:hypothetical protein N7499_012217 [Penicillium canescens]|uniref:Uncharacterized protein n=2 Tax=Penicillium canescens TaxID=5083 RepID=A0AAD6I425_PENCN|nr:hypothetical protein N7460_010073 [Penicillium canescens]KAJ6063537.1 hypothetical protein N7499_012217 [Penicillium canescens]KAJ6154967.1 hypothetical protein N7485_013336 [Penicillium canescens]
MLISQLFSPDPLLFLPTRADDDDGGFHESSFSEFPSGAVNFCPFPVALSVHLAGANADDA